LWFVNINVIIIAIIINAKCIVNWAVNISKINVPALPLHLREVRMIRMTNSFKTGNVFEKVRIAREFSSGQ
jgi:hypothetical protein